MNKLKFKEKENQKQRNKQITTATTTNPIRLIDFFYFSFIIFFVLLFVNE